MTMENGQYDAVEAELQVDSFPALKAVIDGAVQHERVMGAVVLVAYRGTIVARHIQGWADKGYGRPMQENTVFRLGSLSKTVTSLLVLRLSEQGVFSLDDPVARYLPDFTPRYEQDTPSISLHQLLTHTSGLSYRFIDGEDGPYALNQISDGLDYPERSWQDNFRRVVSVPLRFPPGQGWRYSIGIDVAGQAASVAAGLSLPQLLEQTFTRPLGMQETSFQVQDPDDLATYYQNLERGLARVVTSLDLGIGCLRIDERRLMDRRAFASGGASLLSTAPDMMRLLLALRTGTLLSDQSRRRLFTDHVAQSPKCMWRNWGYTYGAAISREQASADMPLAPGSLQWVGAFGQKWIYDPHNDIIIVSMTNTAPEGLFGAFPDQVRGAVYQDLGLLPAISPYAVG